MQCYLTVTNYLLIRNLNKDVSNEIYQQLVRVPWIYYSQDTSTKMSKKTRGVPLVVEQFEAEFQLVFLRADICCESNDIVTHPSRLVHQNTKTFKKSNKRAVLAKDATDSGPSTAELPLFTKMAILRTKLELTPYQRELMDLMSQTTCHKQRKEKKCFDFSKLEDVLLQTCRFKVDLACNKMCVPCAHIYSRLCTETIKEKQLDVQVPVKYSVLNETTNAKSNYCFIVCYSLLHIGFLVLFVKSCLQNICIRQEKNIIIFGDSDDCIKAIGDMCIALKIQSVSLQPAGPTSVPLISLAFSFQLALSGYTIGPIKSDDKIVQGHCVDGQPIRVLIVPRVLSDVNLNFGPFAYIAIDLVKKFRVTVNRKTFQHPRHHLVSFCFRVANIFVHVLSF